ILAAAVIGGMGSVVGAVVGAAYMWGIPYFLGHVSPYLGLLSTGVGLLALVLFLPGGLVRPLVGARGLLAGLVTGRSVRPRVGDGIFGAINILVIVLVPFVSVPVSYAADRWKRMPLAIAGAAVWAVFSLLTGLAPAIVLLVAARVGSSFGEVVNYPVHAALIADFYSPNARVKAFGLHNLGSTAGA